MPKPLNAVFSEIDQGAADQGVHGGDFDGIGQKARSLAAKACEEMGHKAGSQEHAAVMNELERRLRDHVSNINLQKTGTMNAGDTFQATGKTIASRMGTTQI